MCMRADFELELERSLKLGVNLQEHLNPAGSFIQPWSVLLFLTVVFPTLTVKTSIPQITYHLWIKPHDYTITFLK